MLLVPLPDSCSRPRTPLIINNWAIPNGTTQHVYGRVAGGVVAPGTNNVAVTMNLSRTLGHQGGDDFYGTRGLQISVWKPPTNPRSPPRNFHSPPTTFGAR